MALPKKLWVVEVEAGQPLKVNPGELRIIHLSQASLGESKNKGSEPVQVSLKFDGQKIVLGTLSSDHFPQINFDLFFEKEFELSHNWKNGSVFFCGYSTIVQDDDELSGNAEAKPSKADANAAKPKSSGKKVTIGDEDEENEDIPLTASGNGNAEAKPSKPDANAAKPKSSGKKEVGKKRPSVSAAKTPVADKKAKVSTPQKTEAYDDTSSEDIDEDYAEQFYAKYDTSSGEESEDIDEDYAEQFSIDHWKFYEGEVTDAMVYDAFRSAKNTLRELIEEAEKKKK